jgi:glucose-6-phosphate 1-dehydrogenase
MFNLPSSYTLTPNILSLCIQPDEGIHLRFETKVPASTQETRSVDMDFHYRTSFGGNALPEAYEILLLDALQGDASLFARSDEIELAWKIVDPLVLSTSDPATSGVTQYEPGSNGPEAAETLLRRDGRTWRMECRDSPHGG